VEDAIEVMRPLPIEPLAGLPAYVLGASLIRGRPTPVLDLARLLGEAADAPITRFLTVRDGDRPVALALPQVLGLREMAPAAWQQMPSLLEGLEAPVEALGAMPEGLATLLRASRLCPPEIWGRVEAAASAARVP
jgi:purine-binding chemotaxis protein CheW